MYEAMELQNPRKEREGCFGLLFKLMKVHQTSVYNLVWKRFLVYLIASYITQALYQFALGVTHQHLVGRIRDHIVIAALDDQVMIIVLACYMVKMVDRFAETCRLIRFPDDLIVVISSAIPGYTTLQRTLQSTIVRYVLASYVLTLNKVSNAVQKKFPDLSTIVNAGILTTHEASKLRDTEQKKREYIYPLHWAGHLVSRGRSDMLMSRGALELLLGGLAAQTNTMSQLLDHDKVGPPTHYTTALLILVFVYNVSGFIHQVIPEKGDLSDPLTFVLNPLPAAFVYACYHSILKVAEIISQPFKSKHDYLKINQLVDDRIEAVSDCFRKLLVERTDVKIDEWYDHALADEMRMEAVQHETELAPEEQVDDNLYEQIGPARDDLKTSPSTTSTPSTPSRQTEQVPALPPGEGEAQKRHTVLVQSPGVTPSVSVELVQERTRSHQQSLRLGLKRRQEDLQNFEDKLNRLRNANNNSDRVDTGEAFELKNNKENGGYVEIEAWFLSQQQEMKTNPAIRCKTCYKFRLTDKQVRDLEEKTNGFDDISKYKKLQCKCMQSVGGVWV